MLNRITEAEWLPDGSGKPGEGSVLWLSPSGVGGVPDLQRTAGTEADDQMNYDSPKPILGFVLMPSFFDKTLTPELDVCTYICIVKLEDAIQQKTFGSEKQKAVLNLMYTTYILKTRISAVMKELDLTMEQYNVLRILKGKHPQCMCVKDITGRMIERSSNVPRIADRLVTKKLIRRYQSKEDKRHTSLSLTEKGLEVLQTSLTEMEQLDRNLSFLSDSEVKQLNLLLEKINTNI